MINKINRFKSFYLIQFDSNSIFFLLFQCLFCQIKDGVYRVLDYNDAQRFAALRWPPKDNLIINRDLSGGYCKTAVSRWPFS